MSTEQYEAHLDPFPPPGGPLSGVVVLEVGGVGPVPHFAMMCADLGAKIVRIDKCASEDDPALTSSRLIFRGRRSVALDLKAEGASEVLLRLAQDADVLVEGFRPGVAERLGFGPEECLSANPRLVYGRMTGWGAPGPYASKGGHDINYIGLSGALGSIGPADRQPTIPLNLVGDYGGGSMLLLASVLAALYEREKSGKGQLVEVAMLDGAINLMAQHYADRCLGHWSHPRGGNMLDGGAPFYNVYETKDGRSVAVGAGEAKFYRNLLESLNFEPDLAERQYDREIWPSMRERFAEVFKTRTREEWERHFADVDACVTPILTMEEAPLHPHNVARGLFGLVDGVPQPNPPFRFSRTCPAPAAASERLGADTLEVLAEAGYSPAQLDELYRRRVISESSVHKSA